MINPRKQSHLLSGTGVVFAGNILSASLGFLLLVLLSRSLAPTRLGILSPIVGFLDLSQIALETVFGAGTIRVAARLLEREPHRAEKALKIAFWMRVASAAAVAGLGWLGAPWLSIVLFGDIAWVGDLRLVMMGIVGVAVYTSMMSVLQTSQRFVRLSLVTLYKNLSRVAGVGLLIVMGVISVQGVVLAYASSALICALLALLTVPGRFLVRPGFDGELLREMMSINKWMVVVMFAHFGGRIDILMLSNLSTPVQVGWYTAAFQLSIVVAIVSQSLVTTLLPRVSAFERSEQMRSHLRRCLRLVPLALVPLVLVVSVSGWLIPLLLGESYANAAIVFDVILASSFITLIANPVIMLLFPLERANLMALGTLAQVLLRIGLNLVLIPRYDALGAAMADVIGRIVPTALMLGATVWLVMRRLPPAASEQGDPKR